MTHSNARQTKRDVLKICPNSAADFGAKEGDIRESNARGGAPTSCLARFTVEVNS